MLHISYNLLFIIGKALYVSMTYFYLSMPQSFGSSFLEENPMLDAVFKIIDTVQKQKKSCNWKHKLILKHFYNNLTESVCDGNVNDDFVSHGNASASSILQ
jgi:hypothetical protein